MAAFQRQKRLSNLDRVMRKLTDEKPTAQTPQQLLRMVEHFNRSFRGKDLRKK